MIAAIRSFLFAVIARPCRLGRLPRQMSPNGQPIRGSIRALIRGGVMLALLLSAQGASSQAVSLIVPFAAGGPTDLVGRLLAREMGEVLGQQIVVENVGGAGGTIGTARAAAARPDGNTFLLGNIGHAIAPYLNARLPYRPVEDFQPIGLVVDVPMTLVGKPGLPARTISELREWVAANRGRITIAHAGLGASSQLCALLVMRALGDNFTQVSYTGTARALSDVAGGHVDLLCDQVTNAAAQIGGGQVRGFFVSSGERLPVLPDVPTMREIGLADAAVVVWHGLYAPAATPPDMVARLSNALQAVLRSDSVRARLAEIGASPVPASDATPEALRDHLAAELVRWKIVIEEAGLRPQ